MNIIGSLRDQVSSLMQMRIAYGEMYCEKYGIGPTGGFCVKNSEENVGGNRLCDKSVCNRMAELFVGASVLDLGCGVGLYGKCLGDASNEIRWRGFDGAEGIEKATGRVTDLKNFDCINVELTHSLLRC